MSDDVKQALVRQWSRLRRAHLHNKDNEGAKRWERIDTNNHIAEAVAETYRRRREA